MRYLSAKCPDARFGKEIRVIPSQVGRVRIWEDPQPGRSYTMGLDVAEGKVRDRASITKLDQMRAERDFSAGYVLDDVTGDIVVAYHGNVNPHQLAEDILPIALWFNQALLAIEVSGGFGRGTQSALQSWGYRNFYVPIRRELLRPDFGEEPQPGFLTSGKTRPVMIQLMHQALAETTVGFRDLDLLKELATMEVDDAGKLRGVGRNKDDRAMAYMIAMYVRSEKLVTEAVGKKDDPLAHLPMNDRRVWESVARLVQDRQKRPKDTDPDEELFHV